MAVNIHITIIELNALHTKRQNLYTELDAVIHLLMEAKHWGLRKSRNATSLNSSFNNCYTHNRDLHSFPTRRSSGLSRAVPAAEQFSIAVEPTGSVVVVVATGEENRSEEHTSELQSQFHLVCRLLLEKKNNGD